MAARLGSITDEKCKRSCVIESIKQLHVHMTISEPLQMLIASTHLQSHVYIRKNLYIESYTRMGNVGKGQSARK